MPLILSRDGVMDALPDDALVAVRRQAPDPDPVARVLAVREEARQAARLTGRKIILIDDVMTSGATLRACTAACQAAEARDVHVLVLARVNGSVTGREWPSNT